jgi:hypothetical protein
LFSASFSPGMDFLQLGGECSDQFRPFLSLAHIFPVLAVHGALQDAYGECLKSKTLPVIARIAKHAGDEA